MEDLENSSRHWDNLWTNKLTSFYARFSVSRPFENFIRGQVYFKPIDKLLDNFSLKGKEILELGSGTGSNSLYLAQSHNAKSVTLVDFSEKALDRVKTELFSCPVAKIQEDLLKFSPQKHYDFVHSTGLIEHFTGEERLRTIKKHAQCVCSGGLVMIWVPIYSPVFKVIKRINHHLGIREIPFTKEELKSLCQKSGLKILREGKAVFGALYGILAKKETNES